MIKNILTSTLCLVALISYSQDKIKVVSSASIFQDMAKNIGGDKITSESIVPIGGDPHTYTPKPSDVELVLSADLILINGLTFEGWITELIENSGTKADVILITEGIDPITSEKYSNSPDPHAWMDARNGLIYANNIAQALQNRDPLNIDFYENNLKTYLIQLEELDEYIKLKIDSIPKESKILITSHDAFQYYGQAYDIELNAIMGISTESKAQTKDVMRIAKVLKRKTVPAVFIESTINPKMLKQIASDYNVKIGGELFADSIGDKESVASTYIKMLKHNTDIISNALRGISYGETKVDQYNKYNMYGYIAISVLLLVALFLFASKLNK